MPAAQLTLDEFFAGYPASRPLFDALHAMLAESCPCELRVTRSQVAFRRRRAFAWAWIPARYLRGSLAPLVLSIALTRRDSSPRWKQIVEPRPGRFMHHLELYSAADLDDPLRAWLHEAWMLAES